MKVRVYNIAHQNFDGHQDLGNCVLSQLVPDAKDKIIAVKVDDGLLRATQDPNYNLQAYFSQLDRLNLGNCTEVLLASGGTVYMAEPEVAALVRDRTRSLCEAVSFRKSFRAFLPLSPTTAVGTVLCWYRAVPKALLI